MRALLMAALCAVVSFSTYAGDRAAIQRGNRGEVGGDKELTVKEIDAKLKAAKLSFKWNDKALSVLALLHAGVAPTDPRIEPEIRRIVAGASSIGRSYIDTYYSGIVNMMLAEVHNPDYAITAGMIARNLLSMQLPNGSWGDNS